MRNSQAITLLFLALALVLFFFSLSLLPAAELYCQFKRPAIGLLLLEFLLLASQFRFRAEGANRALTIATFVFAVLGICFNIILLIAAKAKC